MFAERLRSLTSAFPEGVVVFSQIIVTLIQLLSVYDQRHAISIARGLRPVLQAPLLGDPISIRGDFVRYSNYSTQYALCFVVGIVLCYWRYSVTQNHVGIIEGLFHLHGPV